MHANHLFGTPCNSKICAKIYTCVGSIYTRLLQHISKVSSIKQTIRFPHWPHSKLNETNIIWLEMHREKILMHRNTWLWNVTVKPTSYRWFIDRLQSLYRFNWIRYILYIRWKFVNYNFNCGLMNGLSAFAKDFFQKSLNKKSWPNDTKHQKIFWHLCYHMAYHFSWLNGQQSASVKLMCLQNSLLSVETPIFFLFSSSRNWTLVLLYIISVSILTDVLNVF